MQRAALKLGILIFLDDERRLLLDLSGGLGYRIRTSSDINKPPMLDNGSNYGTKQRWYESSMTENGERFVPVGNFRFGYKFK